MQGESSVLKDDYPVPLFLFDILYFSSIFPVTVRSTFFFFFFLCVCVVGNYIILMGAAHSSKSEASDGSTESARHGGTEVDPEKAVALLKKRVKKKDAEAMWILGLCCEYGIGIEKDLERAESLYEQSREKGNEIGEFFAEKRVFKSMSL